MGEMMSGSQKNIMEQIGRSGKGELFILRYLYKKDAPVLPSEISEAMCASTSRISAVLGSLEKKGQIHRETDRSNRRNILVTITDNGRSRIRADLKILREQMITILSEMGEPDAADLVRLLKRFLEIANRVSGDKLPAENKRQG
jgi:DNA-binding MarR family transcriptional regulator